MAIIRILNGLSDFLNASQLPPLLPPRLLCRLGSFCILSEQLKVSLFLVADAYNTTEENTNKLSLFCLRGRGSLEIWVLIPLGNRFSPPVLFFFSVVVQCFKNIFIKPEAFYDSMN